MIIFYNCKILPIDIIEKPKVALEHWWRNSKVRKTVTNRTRDRESFIFVLNNQFKFLNYIYYLILNLVLFF